MLYCLLSPSKTMQFEGQWPTIGVPTAPLFPKETDKIIQLLKKKNRPTLQSLMKLSDKLGQSVYQIIQQLDANNPAITAPALFAYQGDVYTGLEATSFTGDALERAKDQILILSALYGILPSTTAIQPYRLELGLSGFKVGKKSLYEFWKPQVNQYLHDILTDEHTLIDLTSKEYGQLIESKKLKNYIAVDFKELKGGSLKSVSVFGKKARGQMARAIVLNNWKSIEDIKQFNTDNYQFEAKYSTENQFIFVR